MGDERGISAAGPWTGSWSTDFLLGAGDILASSLNYKRTLENVCSLAVQSIADICLIDLGVHGGVDLVASEHRDPTLNRRLVHAGRFLHARPGRPDPVCITIGTGRSFLIPETDDHYIKTCSTSDEHARFMREMEYRSLIIVPLVSQDFEGILGALTAL